MAKVLLINGSPHEKGCTYAALQEIMHTLEQEGIETQLLWLGKKALADCISCFTCKRNGGTCVFADDDVNKVIGMASEIDAVIAGSPVYDAGPTARICAFLDRLFFAMPENLFAGKLAASVVSCRRGGATAAFDRLNKYWTIHNMHIVGSQYWNQVHGLHSEDVAKDEEGLQTMRTLAKNMAWLLKSIEAGRAAHVPFPEYEEHISTNFITTQHPGIS